MAMAMLCLVGWLAHLGARAEVEDLYEAEVPIGQGSEGSGLYQQALEKALTQVLVKLTGQENRASFDPLVQGRAAPLVAQYGYRSREEGKLLLWVRFDPAGVDKLLQEQGLQRWGKSRPAVLAWIAVDAGGERTLLGTESDPEIQTLLLEQAELRGLPVLLPLLDVDDRSQVQFDDVWERRLEVLRKAAQRYQAQAVLAARLTQEADQWVGEWTLDWDGTEQRWQSQGNQEEVLRAAIDEVVAVLAPRSVPLESSGEALEDLPGDTSLDTPVERSAPPGVSLKVTDITTLEDYARVARYLATLAPVKEVRTWQVRPNSITFAVQLKHGDSTELRRAIAQGEVLEAEGDSTEDLLEYRLRP
jgi:hypothetical protein